MHWNLDWGMFFWQLLGVSVFLVVVGAFTRWLALGRTSPQERVAASSPRKPDRPVDDFER